MVGDAHDQRHVVLDQDHGDADIGDLAQQRAETVLVGPHQAGGGLIEQQHVGARGERTRDLDQPAVDMRKIARDGRERSGISDEGKQRFGGIARSCAFSADDNGAPSCPRRSAISTLSSTLSVVNSLVV